jgi:2-keto-3-deoxy-6-phosphogluconate aldolase
MGKKPAIEILLRSEEAMPDGFQEIHGLKEKYGHQIHILIGSVIKPEDVEAAAHAKADGVISGGYSGRVADVARQKGLPYLPGCMTLKEVQAAGDLGLTTIKLFPARNPNAKAIMAPLARTDMKTYMRDDVHKPEGLTLCTTPSEVLQAWENGQTHIILDPAQSDIQWQAIMDQLKQRNMIVCCTGGVTPDNLNGFARNQPVIAVGASYIVEHALQSKQDFEQALSKIQSSVLESWKREKAVVLSRIDPI